ncbi:MAG: T9SS type A sorting domain-containing protein [Bacteroidales bacterium]|nr:T9SS type A sorting domain-containing protein [Bacteroidales bacterium]
MIKNRFRYYLLLTVLAAVTQGLVSQNDISVKNSWNEPLKFPWAGGMNSMQYCELDLNLDGIFDLLSFDRRGNRKLCFINKVLEGVTDYEYAAQYSSLVPDISDWVITVDYNLDGKKDIFTYSPGYAGIIVYKNISDDELKFERVVYPYLKTMFPGGYVNLFVTYADYPGIADVDGDGDMDILTFGVLGSFIDMHKNMSMEKYGNADSLDYEHYTYCWGHVAESDESNDIYLDTCFSGSKNYDNLQTPRHSGSTFLVHDLDDNGLVDILLGDVEFPWLYALYNTGTIDDAHISYMDTLFPGSTDEINMFSMPVAAYIDVNNDGLKDLIASPFDPGITNSQDKRSVWYYKNTGHNTNPDFEFISEDFLQKNMIDMGTGAYPVMFDWDKDGKEDLFIGNYGYYWYSYYDNYLLKSVYRSKISYYRNTGSMDNPIFQLWNNDFAGFGSMEVLGLMPAFEDIDGDGNTDLLVGNSEGTIIYVKNTGDGSFSIEDLTYENINVGEFSAPQLYDLDGDGDKDLIIGERSGNLNYYENSSSNKGAEFNYVTDSLGKINVTDYSLSYNGYSIPGFFRDHNGSNNLVVGSEQGKIFYFVNIDDNILGKYNESNQLYVLLDTTEISFDLGMRTSATITHNTIGNKIAMIAGNYSGGLEYFNGYANVNTDLNGFKEANMGVTVYPNPASDFTYIELGDLQYKTIELIDIYGNIVDVKYNYLSDSIIKINLSGLAPGIYYVRLMIEGGIISKKLMLIK